MKNKKKILIVINIILGIMVVLLGGYIIYDKLLSKEENKEEIKETNKQEEIKEQAKKETNKQEDEELESTEKELTNLDIKNILDEKISAISIQAPSVAPVTLVENLYKEETYSLSDKDKLFVTLFNVEWLDWGNKDRDGYAYALRQTIDQKYYELFGEYPQDSLFIDDVYPTCPDIFCDEDKCYNDMMCGITDYDEADEILKYNYKYSNKEDEYYVYQSVGVDSWQKLAIYKDVFLKRVYKSWESYEENNDFKIDESNYQDFSKYKWTFIKSNDNYYFKSLEKIN